MRNDGNEADLPKRLAAAEAVAIQQQTRADALERKCNILLENMVKVKAQVRDVGQLMDLFSEQSEKLHQAERANIKLRSQLETEHSNTAVRNAEFCRDLEQIRVQVARTMTESQELKEIIQQKDEELAATRRLVDSLQAELSAAKLSRATSLAYSSTISSHVSPPAPPSPPGPSPAAVMAAALAASLQTPPPTGSSAAPGKTTTKKPSAAKSAAAAAAKPATPAKKKTPAGKETKEAKEKEKEAKAKKAAKEREAAAKEKPKVAATPPARPSPASKSPPATPPPSGGPATATPAPAPIPSPSPAPSPAPTNGPATAAATNGGPASTTATRRLGLLYRTTTAGIAAPVAAPAKVDNPLPADLQATLGLLRQRAALAPLTPLLFHIPPQQPPAAAAGHTPATPAPPTPTSTPTPPTPAASPTTSLVSRAHPGDMAAAMESLVGLTDANPAAAGAQAAKPPPVPPRRILEIQDDDESSDDDEQDEEEVAAPEAETQEAEKTGAADGGEHPPASTTPPPPAPASQPAPAPASPPAGRMDLEGAAVAAFPEPPPPDRKLTPQPPTTTTPAAAPADPEPQQQQQVKRPRVEPSDLPQPQSESQSQSQPQSQSQSPLAQTQPLSQQPSQSQSQPQQSAGDDSLPPAPRPRHVVCDDDEDEGGDDAAPATGEADPAAAPPSSPPARLGPDRKRPREEAAPAPDRNATPSPTPSHSQSQPPSRPQSPATTPSTTTTTTTTTTAAAAAAAAAPASSGGDAADGAAAARGCPPCATWEERAAKRDHLAGCPALKAHPGYGAHVPLEAGTPPESYGALRLLHPPFWPHPALIHDLAAAAVAPPSPAGPAAAARGLTGAAMSDIIESLFKRTLPSYADWPGALVRGSPVIAIPPPLARPGAAPTSPAPTPAAARPAPCPPCSREGWWERELEVGWSQEALAELVAELLQCQPLAASGEALLKKLHVNISAHRYTPATLGPFASFFAHLLRRLPARWGGLDRLAVLVGDFALEHVRLERTGGPSARAALDKGLAALLRVLADIWPAAVAIKEPRDPLLTTVRNLVIERATDPAVAEAYELLCQRCGWRPGPGERTQLDQHVADLLEGSPALVRAHMQGAALETAPEASALAPTDTAVGLLVRGGASSSFLGDGAPPQGSRPIIHRLCVCVCLCARADAAALFPAPVHATLRAIQLAAMAFGWELTYHLIQAKVHPLLESDEAYADPALYAFGERLCGLLLFNIVLLGDPAAAVPTLTLVRSMCDNLRSVPGVAETPPCEDPGLDLRAQAAIAQSLFDLHSRNMSRSKPIPDVGPLVLAALGDWHRHLVARQPQLLEKLPLSLRRNIRALVQGQPQPASQSPSPTPTP
ncbi:hypothetical protein PAPYR_7665 [Paratrimastix pyriformis]|uniref:Uncharacterized protein n=1 Tax=Paratrimastix pyriformis TaxID=342808 RepID=A0ABQ8UCE4_9EUKA|nr:hypothetical protein PAPYR_7665 [Paratrimastix pyriformis]